MERHASFSNGLTLCACVCIFRSRVVSGSAVVLMVAGFAPHFKFEGFFRTFVSCCSLRFDLFDVITVETYGYCE